MRQGLDGKITILCGVDAGGRLQDCSVVHEDPVDEGFGQAALGLAPRFRMAPESRSGVKTEGGEVRIPLWFRLPRQ
ncbi:energy transducer TonB [Phenylobacterium sp. J367]|nr:energy transducer TonB [Phenylobacterium sp. J367]